jgi:hypothetical protein
MADALDKMRITVWDMISVENTLRVNGNIRTLKDEKACVHRSNTVTPQQTTKPKRGLEGTIIKAANAGWKDGNQHIKSK